MMGWVSLILLFVIPAADLSMRLLGAPPFVVALFDVALVAVLLLVPLRFMRESRPSLRTLAPGLTVCLAVCLVLAVGWYVLRVSAFAFSPFGENIFDLHYIASLTRAGEMPAADIWNPGTDVSRYYYLGFYSVAFYTELAGLDIGRGYAVWMLLVPIVVFANYWTVIRGGMLFRALAAFTATFPSTGLSLLVASRMLDIDEHLLGMAHVRLPEWVNLAASKGSYISAVISGNAYPIEGLAHLLAWLGDLHSPVYTFVLLSIVISAIFRHEDAFAGKLGPAIAGCAVPLSYVINPWTLPCFALLAAYAVVRQRTMRSVVMAIAGLAGMLIILVPVFVQQELQTGNVSLAWLSADQRSSAALFLTVWGPLILASIAVYAAGVRTLSPLLFVAMVVGLELLLMDDPYSGQYERFNGVLKIGSFAMAGWTAVVLIEASRSPRRWLGTAILVPLLAISLLQLADALAPSLSRPWDERNWKLEPVAMLKRPDHQALFRSLQGRCPGLVLERLHATAYSDGPLVSTLLGWPTYSGWPSHMSLLGAMSDSERRRSDAMQGWFNSPEPDLLRIWNIQYVLIDRSLGWSDGQVANNAEKLAPYYRFERLSEDDASPVIGYFAAADECLVSGVAPD